jgi:hypothetical protein
VDQKHYQSAKDDQQTGKSKELLATGFPLFLAVRK